MANQKLVKGIEIELDFCTDECTLEDFRARVECEGGEVEVLQESGPGGGWPSILVKAATKAKLKTIFLKCYDPDQESWRDLSEGAQSF
jgi:hypothetical protein